MALELLAGSGEPPSLLSFGDPAMISHKLVGSSITRGLTFTGSTQIGKQLGALAVQTLKRMTLELGGYAPVIIFGDVDPDAVALSAVTAKFRSSGEVCTSPTRFFVHESIHDRFAAKLTELANGLTVGDGFSSQTGMGPLANARRIEAMDRFVDDARSRGIVVSTVGVRLHTRCSTWPFSLLFRLVVVMADLTYFVALPFVMGDDGSSNAQSCVQN